MRPHGSRRADSPGTRSFQRLVATLALSVAAAAVVKELRKPGAARTWHGQVAGLVPYDFRPPTMARLRAAYWAPDDPRIFLPRPFGVGWSVNFARLAAFTRAHPGRSCAGHR